MKELHRLKLVIIIVAVVGIGTAFKPYGSGSVYCQDTCSTRINFRVEPTGTVTDPCNNGTGGEYMFSCEGTCVPVCVGAHFSPTALGK